MSEKKTISQIGGALLLKIRIPLLVIISLSILLSIGAGVYFTVSESNLKKNFAELEDFIFTLTEAKKNLSDEKLTEKEDEILAKMIEFATNNKRNPAGSRAFMAIADIHFDRKNWVDAREAWLNAIQANPKAYTTALCYYNAAVVSEEANDLPTAVDYYTKASEAMDFPLRSRALFSLARVEDVQGNVEAAKEHYRNLVDNFSNDSWANLANTRLILLETTAE
ncbi:MAG: tetratricopeptide repeat protein [Treponemataceae bacterium]